MNLNRSWCSAWNFTEIAATRDVINSHINENVTWQYINIMHILVQAMQIQSIPINIFADIMSSMCIADLRSGLRSYFTTVMLHLMQTKWICTVKYVVKHSVVGNDRKSDYCLCCSVFGATTICLDLMFTRYSTNYVRRRPPNGPAWSGIVLHGPARSNMVQHVQHGPAPSGTVQHGSTWSSTVQHGPARSGTVRHGPAWSSMIQHGPARSSTVQHGPTWSGTVQHGPARSGTVQHGPARSSTVQHGPARSSTVQHGPARSGTVQHGPARSSTVRHGPARSNIVQHRPARSSMVPHIHGQHHSVNKLNVLHHTLWLQLEYLSEHKYKKSLMSHVVKYISQFAFIKSI